jgi:PPOX class probable F420-dependent enzyme
LKPGPVSSEARNRFEESVIGVLATVNHDGSPHLVPITFALAGNKLVTGVDHKPKRTLALKRLTNIRHNPRVSVLVQHYSPDWSGLWWARADGTATLIEPEDRRHRVAAELLAERYVQYREHPIREYIIEIDIEHWAEWTS